MLEHSKLLELLDYNPATGVFTWRVNRQGRTKAGDKAGAIDTHGYRQIMISQKAHLAGRLAWFYVTGRWPQEQIDHRDGNPLNDAFANLREATAFQNASNRKKRSESRSKYIGVYVSRSGKWQASVCKDGKRQYLGTFINEHEAALAYDAAARALFGDFAKLNTLGG